MRFPIRFAVVPFIVCCFIVGQALAEPHLEERFLAERIAESLLETEVQVVDVTADAPATLYRISPTEGEAFTVEVTTQVWDPEIWSRAIPEVPSVSGASGDLDQAAILEQLLDPTTKTLREIDRSVSAALAENPGSIAANEAAALLHALFAWRERAGYMSDARSALCDVTARLARVQRLQGKAVFSEGGAGQLAHLILHVILDLHLVAEEIAASRWGEAMPAEATESAWHRIIHTRMKSDPRLITPNAESLPLEVAEYLHAVGERRGASELWNAYREVVADPGDSADIYRVVAHSSSRKKATVSAGHYLRGTYEKIELAEANRALELTRRFGRKPDRAEIFAALSGPADPFARVPEDGLISEQRWRAFSQRHLLGASVEVVKFIRESLSVPEAADAFREAHWDDYAGFALFPMAALHWSSDSDRVEDAVALVAPLVAEDRALHLPGPSWRLLRGVDGMDEATEDRLSEHAVWERTALIPGTAFEHPYRMFWGVSGREERFQRVYEMAPYSAEAAFRHAAYNGEDAEAVKRIFGEQFAISPMALTLVEKFVLKEVDLAKLEEVLEIRAQLVPASRFTLADFQVASGKYEDAAANYDIAWKSGGNSVLASNTLRWLMHYRYRTGDRRGAREVAEFCGGVYSARGLRTLAEYHILEGELERAAEIVDAKMERYPDGDFLHRYFWLRYGDPVPLTAQAERDVREFYAEIFPDGIESVELSDFEGEEPPTDYMTVKYASAAFLACGLRAYDRIVAIEGDRVRNIDQYARLSRSHFHPEVTVIIWREGSGYQEHTFELNGRRWGVRLSDPEDAQR